MTQDKDPFNTLEDETLRRAEEMCANLGSGLSLDRRGQAMLYDGSVADLDDPIRRVNPVLVTVAETADQPWLTLVSDFPLKATRNALLVYKVPPGQHLKYTGEHGDSQPGKRGPADEGRFVVRFNIVRDVRNP